MSESGSFKDVRREVAYAYEKVKFFKTHMEMSGLRPDDIKTLADFKRIPVTRKLHYRRNYPSGVLAAGFTLTGPHVMRFQSSGTSGERLNSAIDRAARILLFRRRIERLKGKVEVWVDG